MLGATSASGGVGAVRRFTRTICAAGSWEVNPWAAAASLERQHLAVPHDLATPDPARFAAPQRAGEALEPDRAGGAQRLRPFEVRR